MSHTLDEVKDAVRTYGPHIVEFITCAKCGKEELAVHPFCESFNCACGHRNASKAKVHCEED